MGERRSPVGRDVVVRTLGNKRGVIVEVGRHGQYRVRVGSVTTWCREADLDLSSGAPTKSAGPRRRDATKSERRAPGPPRRIDLHGLRVDEALARVVDGIDRALLDGADRLEIIHGKGSGRIRDALHEHLASMRVVVSFELDPDNPGVTRVHF
jgi:DNA mismatch repair protein MutS2